MMREVDKANLLVTGGAGFMGSHFIKYLIGLEEFKGHIINLDALTYCGNLDNLDLVKDHPRYKFIKGNILDASLVEQVLYDFKINIIVHFAAESHVDRSIKSSEEFFLTNVIGTLRLLEAMKKFKGIHFHHISTDEVYGHTHINDPFTESSPYYPNSPYAASKASSDHVVRSYGRTYQLSTCISHSVNNYGPFQFPEKLIPLVISRLLERREIPIYGSGRQIRDWIYVEDHSKAVYNALKYGQSQQVYNFSAREKMENIKLVETVIDIFCRLTQKNFNDHCVLITHVEDRPAHDFCYAVDPSISEAQLMWKAQTSLEQGLLKTVSWYLDNNHWIERIKTLEYRQWFENHYGEVGV